MKDDVKITQEDAQKLLNSLGPMPEATAPEKTIEEVHQDAVEAKPRVIDPVETSSMMFSLYYPRFVGQVDKLSNKSLRRLIKAIIGEPLEPTRKNLKIDEEREAFEISQRLIEAKMTLMLHTAYEAEKAKQKKAEETKQEEPVATTVIEETNSNG